MKIYKYTYNHKDIEDIIVEFQDGSYIERLNANKNFYNIKMSEVK